MDKKNMQDALAQNLQDAGCDESTIEQYLKYGSVGCLNMQLCILSKQRSQLLDSIHKEQKKLDCLDFLIYKIKGGKNCG